MCLALLVSPLHPSHPSHHARISVSAGLSPALSARALSRVEEGTSTTKKKGRRHPPPCLYSSDIAPPSPPPRILTPHGVRSTHSEWSWLKLQPAWTVGISDAATWRLTEADAHRRTRPARRHRRHRPRPSRGLHARGGSECGDAVGPTGVSYPHPLPPRGADRVSGPSRAASPVCAARGSQPGQHCGAAALGRPMRHRLLRRRLTAGGHQAQGLRRAGPDH